MPQVLKKKKAREDIFEKAQSLIPGGVNSPVRAFCAVGTDPVWIRKGKGPFLWDESGKKYLDFCGSWGPLLFGHAPQGLIDTLQEKLKEGTSFGAATRQEVELAQKIRNFFPSIEKVRMVSSGTEAVMSAVRLARGFTGREKIIKIEGGYHGHADSLLVKAGSGALTYGVPGSAGVPKDLAKLTLTLPFNDRKALEAVFKKEKGKIAALILEPVPANMGVVLPEEGYLYHAREWTRKDGALLILDEVITGFRVMPGGAQEYYGIKPDLTCLGKILGGGLPIAAFGGRAEIMDCLAPLGPVYQAGTLSGNPVAVASALWMLDRINAKRILLLNQRSRRFFDGIREILVRFRRPWQLNTSASMFTLFFTSEPVRDDRSARQSDTKKYARFFRKCLKEGLYLAPSQFEANFISTAHEDVHLEQALSAFRKVLKQF
ncbi:MAG: glutamate-1-semialdehyde 2,1-aminomutase [Candidatus Omnitrophica bacterium]|nr:glutamate-1-semialdehyde 2,1-aminomutase [Candidatus Omnitrophota bacterium]